MKSAPKSVRFLINVHKDKYTVYAYVPIGPDKDDTKRLLRTAEFLTRVNCGLILGNFELDMNDGEIRYKVCTGCDEWPASTETIRSSVYVPALTIERYGNGLLQVIYSDITPKEAYEQCGNRND